MNQHKCWIILILVASLQIWSTESWSNETILDSLSFPCNIPRASKITLQQFQTHYRETTPVILENMVNNSPFRYACEKDRLLELYSDQFVTLSSANSYSYDKKVIEFGDYIGNHISGQDFNVNGADTYYQFGDNAIVFGSLVDGYVLPDVLDADQFPSFSFGIAGDATGVPFHVHGAVLAEVIWGKKHWFLYPPEEFPAFNPDVTSLIWRLENYDFISQTNPPMECTLLPGEVLYIPSHWHHSTLNIGQSVFISAFI
eukprot:TRINITY_DN1936_c0_g1_i1.p1 TRINITY_DN1936_c0_g1~~TRINITY_DN1936_c0_g1_i1.p1  ORF type:complete len:257 (-),score=47.64 TRINITY_DN1936_c0_g1_i1:68-838(-)